MQIGPCVCTNVIVRKSKGGEYPLVFRTIYKQEENDKWAFYNNGQLE